MKERIDREFRLAPIPMPYFPLPPPPAVRILSTRLLPALDMDTMGSRGGITSSRRMRSNVEEEGGWCWMWMRFWLRVKNLGRLMRLGCGLGSKTLKTVLP